MTGPIPINVTSSEPIGFSFNLTNGIGHTIAIVPVAASGSGAQVIVQDIRFQGQTISAQGPLETNVSSSGTIVGNNVTSYGGQIDFNLSASYFGGPATPTPTPVVTPTPTPVVTPTPTPVVTPTPTPVPTPTPTPVPTPSVVFLSSPAPTPTPTPISSEIFVGGTSQYKTIQQGIQAAQQAGLKTVVVAAGTYTENDVLTSANNGLTITAASNGVIVVGSDRITGASGITLSGLTFQGNAGNTAIYALNSQNLTITNDTFTGTGEGVVLDGTGASSVSDNLMTNTTRSAIEAMNGAVGNVFDSNVINGDNAPDTIGAIYLHGANNSTITHNQITNTTGAAIALSDFYGPGTTATENNNSVIAYNSLNQVDTQSSDSGAIYILGRSQDANTGITVKMNFIGTTGSPGAHAMGIYLDDNASGVSVTQNIVQATPAMSDVFEIHGGSNNTFSGNIFDLGTGSTTFGLLQQDEGNEWPQGSFAQLANNVMTGNIYTTESASPHNPGFANLTGGIGSETISANDFWAFSGAALNVSGSGAVGDSAAVYAPPSLQVATSLSSYATWSGTGIKFKAINTSLIGTAPTGAHPY